MIPRSALTSKQQAYSILIIPLRTKYKLLARRGGWGIKI